MTCRSHRQSREKQELRAKLNTSMSSTRQKPTYTIPSSVSLRRSPTSVPSIPTQLQTGKKLADFNEMERKVVMKHRQELVAASHKLGKERTMDTASAVKEATAYRHEPHTARTHRSCPSIPSSRGYAGATDPGSYSLEQGGNSVRLRLTNYFSGGISPAEDRYLSERMKSPTFRLLQMARETICRSDIETARAESEAKVAAGISKNDESAGGNGKSALPITNKAKTFDTSEYADMPGLQSARFNRATFSRDGYINKTICPVTDSRAWEENSSAVLKNVDKETIKSDLVVEEDSSKDSSGEEPVEEESQKPVEPEGPSSVVCMLDHNKTSIFIRLPRF